MNLLSFFYIFITSLMTSIIMIHPISKLAIRIGGMDMVDERKIHSIETPRLGGIAIFCAFLFTVLFFIDIDRQIKAFLAGAVVIFLTGLADDLIGLRPYQKLIGEVLAATLAIISGGIILTSLGNPFGLGEIQLGFIAIPFTVFAVVGVINAVNLIDGLDGLAGGTSVIACIAFGIFSYKAGNSDLLALIVALAGAVMGFLRYNTYPARIFMGDSGSLFLGYCMGVFSVLLLNTPGDMVSPVAPLMVLGIPVLDTLAVMIGRKRRGEPVSRSDKTHIHHRLLNMGFGHSFSVLLVYGLSYFLAASALMLHGSSDSIQLVALVVFIIVLYLVLNALSTSVKLKQYHILYSNKSILDTYTYRSIAHYSRFLLIVIKYLLLAILTLIVFVTPDYSVHIIWVSGLLLTCLAGLFILRKGWGNFLLESVVYFSGLTSIFIVTNYGRQTELAGIKLIFISNSLFVCLFVAVVTKVLLLNRTERFINSPFEYFILFIVIAVPLLPTEISAKFHLMNVAAESVVLFVAFRLVLMRHVRNNRKIIAAIFVSLLVLMLKVIMGCKGLGSY